LILLWLVLCSFVTSLRLGAGALTTADAAKWALAESSVFDIQSEVLEPCGNEKKKEKNFSLQLSKYKIKYYIRIAIMHNYQHINKYNF